MLEEVEGFILTETPYKESSKILNVFTKKYGLIGIIAKGAKRPKSIFRSTAMRFTYGVFNIYYKKDKLSILVSIDVINNLRTIRGDITLISYMSYLSDLTNQVVKQNNDSLIYDFFIKSLLKIDKGLDPLVITNILETKYLTYLGVELNLDDCFLCGSRENIITIDSSNGGLICKNCYNNEKKVPVEVYKLLKIYKKINMDNIGDIKIKPEIKNEINLFLNNYYEKFTGIYLKSKSFLDNIISLNME